MTDLSERVRSILSDSKTRLDFTDAIQQAKDLVEEIHRDGTLLDMQKRNAVAAVNASIDVLQRRYDSPMHLNEGLLCVTDVADVLQEPAAGFLAQWFFHVAYSGQEVPSEAVEIARRIVGRRQPDQKTNERELILDLDRYEWLASFGPRPQLSRNNAKGVIVATEVRPLPPSATVTVCSRALGILEIADARSKKSAAELVRDSISHCRKLISEAIQAHSANPKAFMAQTQSFCVRVSLTAIEDILRSDMSFAEIREDIANEVSELRIQLNVVAFRSSSAVFADFQRQFETYREQMLQSINFEWLWDRLKELQSSVKNARRGQRGLNQLAAFHANDAWAIVSGLFEDLKKKQGNAEELSQRLRQIETQIEQLESLKGGLSTGPIKKLQADFRRSAPLAGWVEKFPDRKIGQEASNKINNMRTRIAQLWERAAAEEPLRASEFGQLCTNVSNVIKSAPALPSLLPELSELRRGIEEFSAPLQRTLRQHVDEAFKAFRERVANVQLLTDYLLDIKAAVDREHRRIFSPIDYEELLARATVGRRWAALRDFPEESRPAAFRAAKSCVTEIYKLQARQQRMMAERETRAEEIFTGLEADVAAGVAEAKESPRKQDGWDELVDLDKRLREAARALNEQQLLKLRAALDDGFKQVREARAAFAVEAGRRFAYYNDILGDILGNLEETPSRESAYSAIDRLKPLRASLREERNLLRAQRLEIDGMLSAASQAVEEIFDRATAQSQAVATRRSAELDVLQRQAVEASEWSSAFSLIAVHKQQSAAVRDAQLSIAARRDLRVQLDKIWEDIAEKLQQLRFSRAIENLDATIKRLEQQGWLLIVADVPRIT